MNNRKSKFKNRKCLHAVVAIVALVTGIGSSSHSYCQETPARSAKLIDDFDGGVQNALGGFRNAFQRQPSSATARRVQPGFGISKRCLQISAQRRDSGFCGAWIQFFDMRASERHEFDVSDWSYLSFQVKGRDGEEQFDIRLADRRWSLKEDALTIGPITDFLSGGVTTQWQEVVVPLSRASRLNLKLLASISFEFSQVSETDQEIQIDHLCIKHSAAQPVPDVRVLEGGLRVPAKQFSKAMWVWSTAKLIADDRLLAELFKVCHADNISKLWVQLPYSVTGTGDSVGCQINNAVGLRRFVAQAHEKNIQVHALDGFPEFALRQKHSVPLAVVDAVIAFNESSKANERFAGVHFDNEPYLLLGWHNDERREEILREFLALNAACQRRLRKAGILFGIDVPFWWSMPAIRSGKSQQSIGSVVYNGVRKPASQHCIDLLDNVGIMNYRDTADGADGLIAHGRDLLRYSDSVNGADIFIGVETFRYTPQEVWFVLGLPQAEFARTLTDRGQELAKLSRIHGLKLFHLKAKGMVHVGVEFDAGRLSDAQRAMQKIAACFGHWSGSEFDDDLISQAQTATEKSGEWQGFKRKQIRVASLGMAFSGFVSTRIMPSKVTFADNAFDEIERETLFAEEEFGRFASYRGIALHSWESYSKKRRTELRDQVQTRELLSD
jgi:hypothetical protein